MSNDKAFAIYVMALVTGVLTVLTALIVASGGAAMPPFVKVVEHLALGLGVRAAYKSLGGWNPADWSLGGDPVLEPAEEVALQQAA